MFLFWDRDPMVLRSLLIGPAGFHVVKEEDDDDDDDDSTDTGLDDIDESEVVWASILIGCSVNVKREQGSKRAAEKGVIVQQPVNNKRRWP
jgi:hypothetical protein